MGKLIQLILWDILRNKVVIAYSVLLAAFSWSIFSMEDNSEKGVLSMLNILLLTVPLISILFSTIYLYNSAEFIELLLSQPVKRTSIWLSLYAGLTLSLIAAFLLGAGIPIFLFADTGVSFLLILLGVVITMVFVSMAFLASVFARDKARGIGIAVLLWLYFSLLYDALVLFLLFQFSEYPIENLAVVLTGASPLDLVRILVLMQLESFSMLGYTGAIFKEYFGTRTGTILIIIILVTWIIGPLWISLRKFKVKDI